MCSLPIKNRDKPNFVHILVYMILIDFINILYVYGFGHDEHVQTCSNMFKHVQTCSNMFKPSTGMPSGTPAARSYY